MKIIGLRKLSAIHPYIFVKYKGLASLPWSASGESALWLLRPIITFTIAGGRRIALGKIILAADWCRPRDLSAAEEGNFAGDLYLCRAVQPAWEAEQHRPVAQADDVSYD